MSLIAWIFQFLMQSLFFKWVLSWGGAKRLEGIKSVFFFSWMTWGWNAEQLRLYALVLWGCSSIWFLIGLFNPELRTYNIGPKIWH
ncbi:hypothetical protein [Acinetobacter shaoyimingii]|uniref:Uncharacterized protein n=1 Tax=Acinetobacter shaoyimingii TaxID=2715164 RepID=A0A6G8RUL2_9GAMM|nr:hypothetical protein [Acinetobacter shaoyimingii]QIO05478.1 hypothetical protein G8E00_05690 [Acinetobacter shaoyimingii]